MQLTTDRGNKERLARVILHKSGYCKLCPPKGGENAGRMARRAKSDRHKNHRRN